MSSSPTRKYLLIGVTSALFMALVFVVGEALRRSNEPAALPLTGAGDTPSIPTETGVFELAERGLEYRDTPDTPAKGRSLEKFYARRAYPGAPPVIPHPLVDPASFGGRTCLACHGEGGWVPKFDAFAPVTPHPELASCVQCHVPSGEVAPFRRSTFSPPARPAIHRAALPGSPPPIPHGLSMRDNCLACHGGPAAVREVRTTHPERVNCRQCHVEGATPAAPFHRETGAAP
jgi:nitrate reductase (cytochrome), electron transfer subunit